MRHVGPAAADVPAHAEEGDPPHGWLGEQQEGAGRDTRADEHDRPVEEDLQPPVHV